MKKVWHPELEIPLALMPTAMSRESLAALDRAADYRARAALNREEASYAPEPLRAALLRLADAQDAFALRLECGRTEPTVS